MDANWKFNVGRPFVLETFKGNIQPAECVLQSQNDQNFFQVSKL